MTNNDTHRMRGRAPRPRAAAGTIALIACTVLLAGVRLELQLGFGATVGPVQAARPPRALPRRAPARAAKSSVQVGNVTGYGSVLVTPTNQPVYILSTDPSGSSKCSTACAKTWMPVTASGSPGAGKGLDSSLLSSFQAQ